MTPFSKHTGQKSAEQVQFELRTTDDSISAGMILSCGGHAVLIAAIVFGLPIFWAPEPLPEAIGIEFAQSAAITAAPRVQQPGKPNNKPMPEPEVKKEPPKKETPPPPPATPTTAPPPPPPPEEEEIAAIPDPAAEKMKEEQRKKEEEKKKAEADKKKKKEEERKRKEAEKQRQAEEAALDDLLKDLTKAKPAAETAEKPKPKKADPAPSEPSTGPQADRESDVPLTASQENGFRRQLIPHWNFDAGIANPENYVVIVRIDLAPDGTILKAEILDKSRMGDPVFRSVAESAARAPRKLQRFELVPGEPVPPQVDIVFDLAKAINGGF